MKAQKDKQLEQLVSNAMQKAALETPSFQFTDQVMAAVKAEWQTAATSYTPLIPKYMWAAIATFVIGITAYLWFSVQPTPLNFPALSFNFIQSNPLSKAISAFTFSKITVYAFLLLGVMVCIQIPLLKRYFNKQQLA